MVDLDDSAGYTLTFVERQAGEDDSNSNLNETNTEPDESTELLKKSKAAMAAEAKAIIQEAKAKLDALAASSGL